MLENINSRSGNNGYRAAFLYRFSEDVSIPDWSSSAQLVAYPLGMDDVLSFNEMIARLDISRASGYRLIREGLLTPHYRAARRKTPLFLRSQIDSLAVPRTREDLDRASASA